MSCTRLNPKAEWHSVADGKVNYLIYGKVAVVSVYLTSFTFNGNWQDVVQLDGVIPKEPNYAYYTGTCVTGQDENLWLVVSSTGMLSVRNASATGAGILATFVVALA